MPTLFFEVHPGGAAGGEQDRRFESHMKIRRHKLVRFVEYVRPYWKYLLLAVAGGIVKFTVPLLVPQVTRHLLDNVFLNAAMTREQKVHELLFWAGGMMSIFLFINADRILVLSAGRVVESGTHHELLANGGICREFHRRQFASAETN
jgi:ABC-type multidrug transport system fused ATPase/permease subunit